MTAADAAGDGERADAVIARRELQRVVDYRATLRGWFDRVAPGGYLIVTVPHAFLRDRRLTLPSPWDKRQRRLYTPASLLGEVEEALAPNSYRVRWLGDLDAGYDYAQVPHAEPAGEADVALVVERIAPPQWLLDAPRPTPGSMPLAAPPFAFEPERTRIETEAHPAIARILILKLDHLGDFILSLPALQRLRASFAEAHIDLVVGSWNAALAEQTGLADRVIAFDAFPRNSTEEEPNVAATIGRFRETITDRYDLAVDLRTDIDVRVLLAQVDAGIKAGIGDRARFPFLTIALPLDQSRNEAARPREDRIDARRFDAQGSMRRGHFAYYSNRETVERDCAIVWGPYLSLDPGNYVFDFFIDLEPDRGRGLLKLDVALDDGRVVAERIVSGPSIFQLPFRVERPGTRFEARIWTVEGHPSIGFDFLGGMLAREGPGNLLHQSEYAMLLVELVRLRLLETGLPVDVR